MLLVADKGLKNNSGHLKTQDVTGDHGCQAVSWTLRQSYKLGGACA